MNHRRETALAVVGSEKTLAELLQAQLRKFTSLLPKHIPPERLARLAMEAASRQQLLFQCTPSSMVKALIDCATMGLEPVGKGGVHLVPFKNGKTGQYEVVAITDYRGEITLAYRSGFVKAVRAHPVHQSDEFAYEEGDAEQIVHRPNLQIDRFDRKTLQLVYAIVDLTTGGHVRKVLNMKGVEHYREKSRAKDVGPWAEDSNDFVAMALKTVIRRAMNEVPQSAEYRTLVSNEEAREYGYDEPNPVIIDVDPEPSRMDAKAILDEARLQDSSGFQSKRTQCHQSFTGEPDE